MCRIAANVSKPMYRCAFNRGASSFNQKIVWAICPRRCLKISLSMVIVTDRNLCLSGNVGWNYCWQHWFEISSMLDFSGLTLLFCMELSQWTDQWPHTFILLCSLLFFYLKSCQWLCHPDKVFNLNMTIWLPNVLSTCRCWSQIQTSLHVSVWDMHMGKIIGNL